MAFEHSSDYEVETQSDSPLEEQAPRRPHKSGRHVREEPTTLTELQLPACLILENEMEYDIPGVEEKTT